MATADVSPPVSIRHLSSDPVDVAIVGAGYTGLAAARRLARAGASVVVIERESIGWGASSRNGGQVLTGLKLDAGTLVARYGERRARELFDISRDAMAKLDAIVGEEAIACEYERVGHLQAAWKPAHFRAFQEEQALVGRMFGHRVELVPPSEQRSELGSGRYHGLLVDEGSSAINPAQYVHGLALAAARSGARVVTHTSVTHVKPRGRRWTVSTSGGDIDARDVLMATDGSSSSVSPALERRLVPVGSYLIATETLDESIGRRLLPRRRVAFDSKHFLFYFRLTSDHRLLFGGRAEFRRPLGNSARRAAPILRRGMIEVFPELAEAQIDYAWGGTVTFTRDQMPRAGSLEGVHYAGGYAGHGIAMATYLGDLIARRIAGEPIEHPMLDDSFPPIPLYHGRPWFLPLVGAYYKMKDWI